MVSQLMSFLTQIQKSYTQARFVLFEQGLALISSGGSS